MTRIMAVSGVDVSQIATGIGALAAGAAVMWRAVKVDRVSGQVTELVAERAENRQLRAELNELEKAHTAETLQRVRLEATVHTMQAQIARLEEEVAYWRRRFDETSGGRQ